MTFEQRLALHNAQAELEALRAEGRGMVWANEAAVQQKRPIPYAQMDFNWLAARIRETRVQIRDAIELERIRK